MGKSESGNGGAPAGGGSDRAESLLCVANFPANTGYAWTFIESLYAGLADALAQREIRTWVAYPSVPSPPPTLARSAARPVELPVELSSPAGLRALMEFIRRHGVRVLYLPDRPAWHPCYSWLRLAGVRRIVVHDHSSGARTVPRGAKRVVKRWTRRLPGTVADVVVAVSDYVAQRKREVDLLPAERVLRIWNSIEIPPEDAGAGARLRAAFGVVAGRPVIGCACRAVPEKGVAGLLRAFDRVWRASSEPRPSLVYLGDGPGFGELERVRSELASQEAIVFGGYRPDAAELLGGADICVVPSVWEEAFGLAALEPMARGVAVVATRVGGVPEVVVDGETGLLVPPGDEAALAAALERLLSDAALRRRLGEAGRRRAAELFGREVGVRRLLEVVEPGFRPPDRIGAR